MTDDVGGVTFSPSVEILTRWSDRPLVARRIAGFGEAGVMATFDGGGSELVIVRVQSSCLFSESLGAIDCDCNWQLEKALEIIGRSGGILVYVLEEGRGAGLLKKFEAINLQQTRGINTADAFNAIGLEPDPRKHGLAAAALVAELGGRPIALLTNNPSKASSIKAQGVNVAQTRFLRVRDHKGMGAYLSEKAAILGHEIGD